jgi:hypothetical protein
MVYFFPALVILRLFAFLLLSFGFGIKMEAVDLRPVGCGSNGGMVI